MCMCVISGEMAGATSGKNMTNKNNLLTKFDIFVSHYLTNKPLY